MSPTSSVKKIQAEENDIVTLVLVDTEDFRRYYSNKLVKKNSQ